MDETTKLVVMMETSDDPVVYYHTGYSSVTPEAVMDDSFDPKTLIPSKHTRKRRKRHKIIIPGFEEESNFENNEPVWALITDNNATFLWPSLYNRDTRSALPILPTFKAPKILSVHKVNAYNKEDLVVPEDKKENWGEAVKIFSDYSLSYIVLTALGITTQNIQSANKNMVVVNNMVLGAGYKNLEKFFLASLICLKDMNSLHLEQDDSIDCLKQVLVEMFSANELNINSQNFLTFTKSYFIDDVLSSFR
ncbi:predicted protein [Naegleria gruberi]|uniref:Predicted protein n=1 Tax=Naegleria gruberi TaxID=5762 RepID=D2VMZ7_NAEGR|nr:uncharacterized protein NAEGRDRAFT_70319 [Naegleria gruberi]EFC41908.1 predicted protein [Naegleria gruberi]|eukprot:XP_002674652.1 predicted protein [Naegleria gruberi strain NEG-M]